MYTGLRNALADEDNVTPKSKKLLADCLFQVQLAADGAGTPRAARACPAGKERPEHLMISYSVQAAQGRLRPSRFPMEILFVWRFCMGAQGAEQPKTAVSGPGSGRSKSRCCACGRRSASAATGSGST